MFYTTLESTGKITLPKEIIQKLDLKEGDVVKFSISDEIVTLSKCPKLKLVSRS